MTIDKTAAINETAMIGDDHLTTRTINKDDQSIDDTDNKDQSPIRMINETIARPTSATSYNLASLVSFQFSPRLTVL